MVKSPDTASNIGPGAAPPLTTPPNVGQQRGASIGLQTGSTPTVGNGGGASGSSAGSIASGGTPFPAPAPPANIPAIGRIVHYCLTKDDADAVNRRREHRGAPVLGVKPVGNPADEGEVLPLLIVAVHGHGPYAAVNGQVFLDGNDTLWVRSVSVGEFPGSFAWPDRR